SVRNHRPLYGDYRPIVPCRGDAERDEECVLGGSHGHVVLVGHQPAFGIAETDRPVFEIDRALEHVDV
ncbi:MAG: hypothetical protein V5A29_17240, partial [Haloarculaceae archaeon]